MFTVQYKLIDFPINFLNNNLEKKNYVTRGFGSDMALVRRTQIYGSGA